MEGLEKNSFRELEVICPRMGQKLLGRCYCFRNRSARKEVVSGRGGWKPHGGHVSSWLAFRAAVRHCFDLTYISVLSNRTNFFPQERNTISSARYYANSASRKDDDAYVQMVILYFSYSYSSAQSIFL